MGSKNDKYKFIVENSRYDNVHNLYISGPKGKRFATIIIHATLGAFVDGGDFEAEVVRSPKMVDIIPINQIVRRRTWI